MLQLAPRNQARGCGFGVVAFAGFFVVPMVVFGTGGTGRWYISAGLLAALVALYFAIRPLAEKWQAVRLEVGDDAIVAHGTRKVVKRIERTPAGTLQVTSTQSAHVLQWLENGRSVRAMLMVHPVDSEEFARALARHGWTPGEPGAEPPAPPAPSTTLVLAEGVDRIGARSPIVWILFALAALPLVPALVNWEPGLWPIEKGLLVPYYLLLSAVYAAMSVGLRHHELRVSAERVEYRAGRVVRVCRREGASVRAPGEHVIIAGRGTSLRVAHRGRREELLALLRANGWTAPY